MEESDLRDELAIERTRLANERTFLAYARTALALLAGGAALVEFFSAATWIRSLAGVLFITGCLTLAFGSYRFVQVRNRLKARR